MKGELDWIDELVSDIAKKYKVILGSDDPILVTAILNKQLQEMSYLEHKNLFDKNSQLLKDQLTVQKALNEQLLNEVTDRLINAYSPPKAPLFDHCTYCTTRFQFQSLPMLFLLLAFLLGLVCGIWLVKFI